MVEHSSPTKSVTSLSLYLSTQATQWKTTISGLIYLQQIIQQDNLKTNLGHLLKLFIVGDELAREVEAITQVINIYCDEC